MYPAMLDNSASYPLQNKKFSARILSEGPFLPFCWISNAKKESKHIISHMGYSFKLYKNSSCLHIRLSFLVNTLSMSATNYQKM